MGPSSPRRPSATSEGTSAIRFDLDGAHPTHRVSIGAILTDLARRYPGARLREVRLYDPRPGDTSMAATEGDHIVLNRYWFGRDPAHLRSAAEYRDVIYADGVPMGWHAGLPEPRHVLTHEFGHCVWMAIPDEAERWTVPRWRTATEDTIRAPSGYALAASVREFFAEAFALSELGCATEDEADEMRRLIEVLTWALP